MKTKKVEFMEKIKKIIKAKSITLLQKPFIWALIAFFLSAIFSFDINNIKIISEFISIIICSIGYTLINKSIIKKNFIIRFCLYFPLIYILKYFCFLLFSIFNPLDFLSNLINLYKISDVIFIKTLLRILYAFVLFIIPNLIIKYKDTYKYIIKIYQFYKNDNLAFKELIKKIILVPIICICLYNGWLFFNQIKTSPAGYLVEARQNPHAVLLNDGRIYIIGGVENNYSNSLSAEIYNPKTKKSHKVATFNFPICDDGFSVTALKNGKVLIAGGQYYGNKHPKEMFSNLAYLYDPKTNIYKLAGKMSDVHSEHNATLLDNGNVLITGGYTSGGKNFGLIDLYDVQKNTFINLGKYCSTKNKKALNFGCLSGQRVMILSNNKVLVVGGVSCENPEDASNFAKIITLDQKDILSNPIYMNINRSSSNLVKLSNGNILLSGGSSNGNNFTKKIELFSFSKMKFLEFGQMDERIAYTASLLPNGKVLFSGGVKGVAEAAKDLKSMYIYNPKDKSYEFFGNMRKARAGHIAITLKNGNIIFIGGTNSKLIEVYKPKNIGEKNDNP